MCEGAKEEEVRGDEATVTASEMQRLGKWVREREQLQDVKTFEIEIRQQVPEPAWQKTSIARSPSLAADGSRSSPLRRRWGCGL